MKKTYIFTALLFVAGMSVSCSDTLNLEPIDYYGSESYWKNEAHVKSYVIGMHKNMRDVSWNHMIVFGEMRGGGVANSGATIDGSAINYGDLVNQNMTATNMGGVTGFGGYYGKITNCNLFIKKVTEAEFLTDEMKSYYLGIGYGLRAFYFFDLYRVYGKVPLRTGIEVIEGIIDPEALYMERAECSEVVKQIKADLDNSLKYFGSNDKFDYLGLGGDKCYWSKAATECLMGEVYLWTGKVSTGDYTANEADLDIAKTHLENVTKNYGLSLLTSFSSVFDAKNKNNAEQIFCVKYAENESTNNLGSFAYNTTTGMVSTKFYQKDGITPFGDPLGLGTGGVVMRNEHKKGIYTQFDDKDTRRDATFVPAYNALEAGASEGTLAGLITKKNIGYKNSAGQWIWCGDFPYYRLAWCYLSLAEIANMKDDKESVKTYLNLVRKRAYGDNWDESVYGYTPGDFTQNELAILHEKDKEMVQEGQRWFDVRRMTLGKKGKALVFCTEGNIDSTDPLLTEAESYKLLWPLDQALLNNDDALEQTEGY